MLHYFPPISNTDPHKSLTHMPWDDLFVVLRCDGDTFDTNELIVFDGNTDGAGQADTYVLYTRAAKFFYGDSMSCLTCVDIVTGPTGDGYLTWTLYDTDGTAVDNGANTYYSSGYPVTQGCYHALDFDYLSVLDEETNAWAGYLQVYYAGAQEDLSCSGYIIDNA